MTLEEIKPNEEFNNGSQASTYTLAMNTCQMDTCPLLSIARWLKPWEEVSY